MGFSDKQREWLKELGGLVEAEAELEPEDGAADDEPGADVEPADGARAAEPGKRSRPGTSFGFGPQDILPVIPDVINELTQRRATCAIHNNTKAVLKLDTSSLDEIDDESGKTPGIVHGKYVKEPPSKIDADDQSGRFVAENNKAPILNLSTTGAEGVVRYVLDAQGTSWTIHFNNPFGATGDKNSADARVEGPNAAQFETPKPGMSGKSDVKYLFILNAKGGAAPVPVPVPVPAPGANVPSSCLITVTNNTKLPLVFMNAEHERGNFMTPVPNTVAPGTSVTIASVETPNAKEQGCKGLIIWQVGTSSDGAVWSIMWDNPEGEKNTSKTDFIPQAGASPETAFSTTDQIGQGEENVPVAFTISGGPPASGPGPTPPPGPTPTPTPVPPPEPEVAFEPPAKSKQPTLRKGDKSADGWVEYAQSALNFHLKTNLTVDGNFGTATQAAVFKFQKAKGLQQDGTIGNQTWAALREGVPENVGTDGRKPHSFVEQGQEARWDFESRNNNAYNQSSDTLGLFIVSVGDTPLDGGTLATIRVLPPGGKAKVVKLPIGPASQTSTPKNFLHTLKMTGFRKNFPSQPADAPVTGYVVEAFLPQELGGDFYKGNVREG